MAQDMLDGFDHTQYKVEVEQRWGREAYAQSDAWWTAKTPAERSAWKEQVAALNRDWIAAAERGDDPAGAHAHALAERHVAWLRGIPGTPAVHGGEALTSYVLGLADMYVADERFAANYATSEGGTRGAEFVRDALTAYAQTQL